jgi:hypothetical protein
MMILNRFAIAVLIVGTVACVARAAPESRLERPWTELTADGLFTLRAPPGTSYRREQGIDSVGGEFDGPGFTMTYDFGIYSGELDDAILDARYQVDKVVIDGKTATIVEGPGGGACTGPRKTLVGVHVVGFGGGFHGQPNTLAIWACADGTSEAFIVKAIYLSLRFLH